MSLMFYPHTEDASSGTLGERIEQLAESADRFKASVLETVKTQPGSEVRVVAPKDLTLAYNWDVIASILREVRELQEGTKDDRMKKANYLTKLAEIYEVLRAARMSKLEGVRLALMSEANQLRGGNGASTTSTQVA